MHNGHFRNPVPGSILIGNELSPSMKYSYCVSCTNVSLSNPKNMPEYNFITKISQTFLKFSVFIISDLKPGKIIRECDHVYEKLFCYHSKGNSIEGF